jgi:hypothetical protein
VVAVDAAAFGVSLVALAVLNVPPTAPAMRSPWRDLANGWQQFRMQTWLWPTTVQFALFNLLTWALFLLIGPILARQYMGGARLAKHRRGDGVRLGRGRAGPAQATAASAARHRSHRQLGIRGACLLLSLHLPVYAVALGACAAGVGSAMFGTYWTTVMQRQVPEEMLARMHSAQPVSWSSGRSRGRSDPARCLESPRPTRLVFEARLSGASRARKPVPEGLVIL